MKSRLYLNYVSKKYLDKIKQHIFHLSELLSPRNSVGGDIVMRPFVCGWVSECVCPAVSLSVRPSRSALWARYRLQILPHHFHTLHVRGGTLLIFGHGSKVKVKFGTSSIKLCWHNTGYSFCPITLKLHLQVVDDERLNPIDL